MNIDVSAFGAPMIAIVVYSLIEVIKSACGHSPKMKRFYPAISALVGMVLGVVGYATGDFEITANSVVNAAFVGLCSGLSATGTDQFVDGIRGKKATQEAPQETDEGREE